MDWEVRGDRRYYTRSTWQNGRVVREYVGGGLAGELAAHEDQARRRRAAAEREWILRHQAACNAAAAPYERLGMLADALMRAALLDAGFHRHDRHWRKRRDITERE